MDRVGVSTNTSMSFKTLADDVVGHICDVLLVPKNTRATLLVKFNFFLVEKCLVEKLESRVSEVRLVHRLGILDEASADRRPAIYQKVHDYFRLKRDHLRSGVQNSVVAHFASHLLALMHLKNAQQRVGGLCVDLDHTLIAEKVRTSVLKKFVGELSPYFGKPETDDALVQKSAGIQPKEVQSWIDAQTRMQAALYKTDLASVESEIKLLGKACWYPPLIKQMMNLGGLDPTVRLRFIFQTLAAQKATLGLMFPTGRQSAQQAEFILARLAKEVWLPAMETMDSDEVKTSFFALEIDLMYALKQHLQSFSIGSADVWRVIIKQFSPLADGHPDLVCITLTLMKEVSALGLLGRSPEGEQKEKEVFNFVHGMASLKGTLFAETAIAICSMVLSLPESQCEPLLRILICRALAMTGQADIPADPDAFEPEWNRNELSSCMLSLVPLLPPLPMLAPQPAAASGAYFSDADSDD